MTSGMTDSRWPPRRPDAQRAAALTRYPTYLAPRVGEKTARSFPPLVSALAAYAASFVAQFLVAVPLGIFVLARGVSVVSGNHTDEEIQHAAFTSAMTVIVVSAVAGLLACWAVLMLLGVRGALVVAVAGQVTDFVAGLAVRDLPDLVGLVVAALASVGVMYALVSRRTTPR